MSNMLIPTISEVVRCIGDCVDKTIAPALTRQSERSAVATVRHLLRLIEHRVRDEGQVLWDDAKALRALLPQAVAYLESVSDASGLAGRIRASLAQQRDPDVYPSLDLLAAEVAALRGHVSETLKILLAPGRVGGDALHASIREYITWQIAQEGKVVEPAFRGHGPRR